MVVSIFGFKDDQVEFQISLRDPNDKDKYIGTDEMWASAQNAIIEACKERGLNARQEEGEAAFYGPKLDCMVKDAIGRHTPTIRVYLCDTLEPTYRNLAKESKVEGKTAIPFGTYEIEMGMSRKYSMTMPYLKNVPFFKTSKGR